MADPNSPIFSIASMISNLIDRAGNGIQVVMTSGAQKAHVFHRKDFVPVEDPKPTVIRPKYTLSSAEDLGRWLLARADGRTSRLSTDVLVEAVEGYSSLRISATLDPWVHGSGGISANIKRTPAFAARAGAIGGHDVSVDTLSTLLREHGGFLGRVQVKRDGNLVDGGPAATGLLEKMSAVDVSVMSKGSTKRDASGRVTVSMSSAEADLGPISFDLFYPVTTKLFEGVDEMVYSRLFLYPRVRQVGGTPELVFRLTWPDLQVHVDAAVAKQVEQLRSQLPGWEVNAGTGATQENSVPYNYQGIKYEAGV